MVFKSLQKFFVNDYILLPCTTIKKMKLNKKQGKYSQNFFLNFIFLYFLSDVLLFFLKNNIKNKKWILLTDGKKPSKKKCVQFRLYYKNSKKNFFFKTNNLLKIEEKNQTLKIGMVIAHGNLYFLSFFLFLPQMVIFLFIKSLKKPLIFIPNVTPIYIFILLKCM